ncbi:MAG: hypothetical protein ACFFG0_04465 [Candidatus Thorarchaeota archaeon]
MWESKEFLGYLNGERILEQWELYWRLEWLPVEKGLLKIGQKQIPVDFVFRNPTNNPYENIIEMWTIKNYKKLTDEKLFREYNNL